MNRSGGPEMARLASRSTDPYAGYPVLVYGTLRSGMPNDRLWRGAGARSIRAILPGARLYDLPYGFPAVVLLDDGESAGEPVVHGELVTCEDMPELIRALDRLEGYDPDRPPERNHYQRVLVEVEVPSGERLPAWIYVYTADRLDSIDRARLVSRGDLGRVDQAGEQLHFSGDHVMKAKEIEIGGTYLAKVSGRLVPVRVERAREVVQGRDRVRTVYDAVNQATGRRIVVRSPQRFRERIES